MPIKIVDGLAVTRTLSGIKALDGVLLRTIRRALVMDADGVTLRTVASFSPAMTASASPSSVSGQANGGAIITNAATVTPAGGLAPYTYAWAIIAYDAATPPSINTPTSAATVFVQSGLQASEAATATALCTVTDSVGQSASATVTATFTNTDFS